MMSSQITGTETLRTNETTLVEMAVVGEITAATMKMPFRLHPDGYSVVYPSVGGITYNYRIGDPAVGIPADHVEPAVSMKNKDDRANMALQILACVGNEAKVLSGEGKGAVGRVVGKHGGVNHVMVDFTPDVLEILTVGDPIQVRSVGTGLIFDECPEVTAMNLSPWLCHRMGLVVQGGVLHVPVTHHIPAQLLGAGLGEDNAYVGDVDIQLFDPDTVAQYGLGTLRFGDVVAMLDCDHRYGRIFRAGAVSIGVVTHSCSTNAGHGPGVTTLLTGLSGTLKPVISSQANLATYFQE